MPDNEEGNMRLTNALPSLPGMIGIGTGAKPMLDAQNLNLSLAAGGGSMILGGSQANLLISALQRKQGTDLLSAPRITVMDGQPAQITIAQEFIYPTDYEPAPLPGGGGGGGQNNNGVDLPKQFKFKVRFHNLIRLHRMMNNLVLEKSE
jgi:general secretion pathway protein D